jgi:hypothetical protein
MMTPKYRALEGGEESGQMCFFSARNSSWHKNRERREGKNGDEGNLIGGKKWKSLSPGKKVRFNSTKRFFHENFPLNSLDLVDLITAIFAWFMPDNF